MTRSLGPSLLFAAAVLGLGVGLAGVPAPSGAGAQDAPIVRLEPAALEVTLGQTVTLAVTIEQAVDLAAFQLTLTFDPALLALEGIDLGPFLGLTGRPVTAFEPIEVEPGRVIYQAISGPGAPGASGAGLLATARLAALAPGDTAVGLPEVLLADTAERPTELEGYSAMIRVLPAATASPPPPAPVLLPFAQRLR